MTHSPLLSILNIDIVGSMALTVRGLMRVPRYSKTVPSLPVMLPPVRRDWLDEEIRSRIQYEMEKLREIPCEASFYKVVIDTPEFSRFVFAVPISALLGMTFLSLSPPTTLPLIFERFIPYQIKIIGISLAFHSFVDLAINVIGRPSPVAHHRIRTYPKLFLAWASLVSVASLLSLSDSDPRVGYKLSLVLLALHSWPALTLPMPLWIRTWRLGFIALSSVSVLAAWHKLNYLESHWDSLVFS